MINSQKLSERPRWQGRVRIDGLAEGRWVEGESVVVDGNYASSIGQYTMEAMMRLRDALWSHFRSCERGNMYDERCQISWKGFSEKTSQACAPIRLDLTLHETGYEILDIGGDSLDDALAINEAQKQWFDHHFSSDLTSYCVSYFEAGLSFITSNYMSGLMKARTRRVKIVADPDSLEQTIIANQYLDFLGRNRVSGEIIGLNIKKLHSSDLVLVVPDWPHLLRHEDMKVRQEWTEIFFSPNRSLVQPQWTAYLSSVKRGICADSFSLPGSTILHVWMDINMAGIPPLIVASRRAEGTYDFRNQSIIPVVFKTEG